jgi:hypothetical protein
MNKKTIITILLALVAMTVRAQEITMNEPSGGMMLIATLRAFVVRNS